MRGNPMDIRICTEQKLLELYQNHDVLAFELLNLLKLTETEIAEGSGDKLEFYSSLEKELVSKLTSVVRVLKNYESIESSSTAGVHMCRLKSLELRKLIQESHDRNLKLLKLSIDKTSKMIDSFSMNRKYKFPVINEPSPRFIDFSV